MASAAGEKLERSRTRRLQHCVTEMTPCLGLFSTVDEKVQEDDSTRNREKLLNGISKGVANIVISEDKKEKVQIYIAQYGCVPPPVFLLALTIMQVNYANAFPKKNHSTMQVGVFVHYVLVNKQKPGWVTGCAGCIVPTKRKGSMIFDPSAAEEVWRYVSYMLIQQG
ncbi:unnamed protein product [Soboliphyme baturini]|uniref:Calpain_III domain-containing protein n=1 Tax=Soboliphyme baturini TaxID=241478 RepID=A0A183IV02_9BILA|nr:unnamed protein product [Soboliphyme baturini]